jgi:hypothetical protein
MTEDLNSCHRGVNACEFYSVNWMARLVIGVAIGMGVCPIGWLCAENVEVVAAVASRSTPSRLVVDLSPIPPLVSSFLQRRRVLSPWMVLVDCWVLKMWRWWRGSFPDIGPLRWRKFHPRYWYFWEPGCSAIWYNVGGWVLFLHSHGCDGMAMRRIVGSVHYYFFFSRLRLLPWVSFCLVHFPPINVSYCILSTPILTTSYFCLFIFVNEMSSSFIRVYHRRFTILIISQNDYLTVEWIRGMKNNPEIIIRINKSAGKIFYNKK